MYEQYLKRVYELYEKSCNICFSSFFLAILSPSFSISLPLSLSLHRWKLTPFSLVPDAFPYGPRAPTSDRHRGTKRGVRVRGNVCIVYFIERLFGNVIFCLVCNFFVCLCDTRTWAHHHPVVTWLGCVSIKKERKIKRDQACVPSSRPHTRSPPQTKVCKCWKIRVTFVFVFPLPSRSLSLFLKVLFARWKIYSTPRHMFPFAVLALDCMFVVVVCLFFLTLRYPTNMPRIVSHPCPSFATRFSLFTHPRA